MSEKVSPTIETPAAAKVPGRRSNAALRILRAALRTLRGRIGAGLALFVLAIVFLGPLSPASPTEFAAAPFSDSSVAGAGLLGTDVLGRSVLDRVLHGGLNLMLLAFAATVVAVG